MQSIEDLSIMIASNLNFSQQCKDALGKTDNV